MVRNGKTNITPESTTVTFGFFRNQNAKSIMNFKMCGRLFSFFSSTNVETKNVCPIAYNDFGLGEVGDLTYKSRLEEPKLNLSTKV